MSAPTMPAHVDPLVGWRLSQLELKYERLDKEGSAGVQALTSQVRQLAADFEAHERQHKEEAKAQVAARRWMVGIVVALIGPLYPIILIFSHRGGI